MDEFPTLLIGLGLGLLLGVFITAFTSPTFADYAEFVCKSHGLELINYETEEIPFSKVECGSKKPKLQYDNYKVFEK